MKKLDKAVLVFFIALGIGVILMSLLQYVPAVAKSSEVPADVVAAEDAFQTTLTSYQLAQEAEVQVVATRMEAGVAHCMAWKTLAYAKWNAGMEISTSIDEVERTLCLSGF